MVYGHVWRSAAQQGWEGFCGGSPKSFMGQYNNSPMSGVVKQISKT